MIMKSLLFLEIKEKNCDISLRKFLKFVVVSERFSNNRYMIWFLNRDWKGKFDQYVFGNIIEV